MNAEIVLIFALVCAFLCVLLKKQKSEYAIVLSISACAVIFFEVFSHFDNVFEFIKMMENESVKENTEILIKALLISLLSAFVSDICVDAGEKALSGEVELFGKIMVLTVSLPLFSKLYEVILKILGV